MLNSRIKNIFFHRGRSIFHFQIISFYDIFIVKINVIGSTVLLQKCFRYKRYYTDYIYVFLKIKFNWLQLILGNLRFLLKTSVPSTTCFHHYISWSIYISITTNVEDTLYLNVVADISSSQYLCNLSKIVKVI